MNVDDVYDAFFRAQEEGVTVKFIDEMGTLFRFAWGMYVAKTNKESFRADCEKIISAVNNNHLVSDVIERNINCTSVEEIEMMVLSVVKRELDAITWFGAALGAVIGLIQVLL